jgi:1,4-dihydroxy-2-naphthoate octaprenyltransferase
MAVLIGFAHPPAFLALLALPLLWKPVQALRSGATGRALVPVLATTGLFEIAYAVLLAIGIGWGS